MRPTHGIVVVRVGTPQLIDSLQHFIKILGNSIEKRHFIQQSLRTALGASAVIALNKHDQRIVELTGRFDCIDHSADVMVGMRKRGGIDFHHASKNLLLLRS
jgi:Arc/MetJ family transcription regulator